MSLTRSREQERRLGLLPSCVFHKNLYSKRKIKISTENVMVCFHPLQDQTKSGIFPGFRKLLETSSIVDIQETDL